MTKISVNVNKIALIRNSRDKNNPNILKVASDLINFGAHGITVHPRPDGRHIRRDDVYQLNDLVRQHNKKQNTHLEFNVEGYPSEDFLRMLEEVSPHQATLVPDPPEALTSNAGWDFVKNKTLLKEVCTRLKQKAIRVSLFLDPATMDDNQWRALGEVEADRIELYTESFADAYPHPDKTKVVAAYKSAAEKATSLGLGINAGHDLNLENLGFLLHNVPQIQEVSIGHALVGEALYLGFKETLKRYLEILKTSHVS